MEWEDYNKDSFRLLTQSGTCFRSPDQRLFDHILDKTLCNPEVWKLEVSYVLQIIYLKVGTWAEFLSEVRVHIPRPAIIVCLEDLKLYIISWWAWHYRTQGHILLFLSPRDVAKSSNSSLRCRDAGCWRLKITLSTHYGIIKNLVRTDNWADKSLLTLFLWWESFLNDFNKDLKNTRHWKSYYKSCLKEIVKCVYF